MCGLLFNHSNASFFFFFFFNDTATTEIYTLSLHDALPISVLGSEFRTRQDTSSTPAESTCGQGTAFTPDRSEEHTSELQSHLNLVCRLLLEKKKKKSDTNRTHIRRSRRSDNTPTSTP